MIHIKITKKQFNFSIKKSVNYNSVNVGQGIEVEYDEEDTNAVNIFENLKTDLKIQVHKQIDEEEKKLNPPKEEQKDLLG